MTAHPPGDGPTPPDPQRRLLSLRDDVVVEIVGDDHRVVALAPWGPVELGVLSAVGRTALWRLTLGPVDPANLVGRDAPTAERSELSGLLHRLRPLVVRWLGPQDGGEPVLSVVPLAPDVDFVVPVVGHDDRVRLSHHASLRRSEHGLSVGSTLAPFRVELHRSVGGWVSTLLTDTPTVDDLTRLAEAPSGLVVDLVSHLVAAGMVCVAEPDGHLRGRFDEDDTAAVGVRAGGTGPVGPPTHSSGAAWTGASRSAGILDEIDAILSSATAVHRGGPAPTRARDRAAGPEIELYVTVADGEDRPGGVYRRDAVTVDPAAHDAAAHDSAAHDPAPRDPVAHRLVALDVDRASRDALRERARAALDLPTPPAALVSITRPESRSTDGSGRDDARTLLHVGAFVHTVRRTAAARGLSSHVLTPGDIDATTPASRTPWPSETLITELLFGA